jgi:proteasome accessory factor PafA2
LIVAIAKVCGTETEYGIQITGTQDPNPISASSLLVNAYVAATKKVGWDFEDESPARDARGFTVSSAEIETHLANAVLTNGARYYVDHAHPELSTPECRTPSELVIWDKAGEEILRRSMLASASLLPPGQAIVVYKNNSDGKGNSYGCHENYLMDRAVPFTRIAQWVTPHFVTRQIFTGAGKVGVEGPGAHDGHVPYQISQRADFFEEQVGLETTIKRPIVNTRDEPHSDPRRFRRLHVIVGDANLAEVAIFLKIGTTALVLAMIEDDFFGEADLLLESPVKAIREISHDPSLSVKVETVGGRRLRALDVQWELFELASKYVEAVGGEALGDEEESAKVLRRWEEVLDRLEQDPGTLKGQLDWVAKRELIEAYIARHGLEWSDRKVAAMDLQYHDVRKEKSLFARLDTERLTTDAQVARAVVEPPESTRAWFRGQCLARWPQAVTAANWDSVVFDLGSDPLRRVPMLDPLKGTKAGVGALFEGCSGPVQLLERLSS